MTGALRFVGSAGDEYALKAGQTMLVENTTGKGHATEVISTEPVEGLIVRLDWVLASSGRPNRRVMSGHF
jgi:hypothetical protein